LADKSTSIPGVLVPSTTYQLLILVGLVLPGIVFGATLARLRGPTPDDKDASTRLLRAVAIGAALDVLYVLAVGPHLASLIQTRSAVPGGPSGLAAHLRESAVWVLLLAGVVPALLAYFVHARAVLASIPEGTPMGERLRRLTSTTYRTTPTAWDQIATRRGGCFVRIRLQDGEFIGGWVGEAAFVSGYPEPRDIFIPWQWALDPQGRFLQEIKGTLGVYVPLPEGVVVEWLRPPIQPGLGGAVDQANDEEQDHG
jgi:hypothetical protein